MKKSIPISNRFSLQLKLYAFRQTAEVGFFDGRILQHLSQAEVVKY
jgi:hypothetical protein